MKTLLLFSCSLFSLIGFSQKSEKIFGNARQHKSIGYYKEQSAAWERELEKNPKDAAAWYNYYYANRNILFNDTVSNRSPKEKSDLLNSIVDKMGKAVPESYEYNIAKWQIGGNDPKFLPYLKKAIEIGEGRTEHLDYMINQGELTRNIKDREIYSQKKFEAGQFSTGVIYYNYNVLMGLRENAILITSGDNDTYPIWYLQSQGIRKDVTVINMYLVQLDDYREKLFQELGLTKWEKPAGSKVADADHEHDRNTIITHIASNSKNYPLYLALTTACDDKYTKAIQEKLYLTGLAYLYSKEPIDNIALLKNNVEHQYAFDYLDKPFYHEISPDIVKMVNGNYIVPLLTLYDHYKLAGENLKSEWTKSKLLTISKGTDNEVEIIKHLQAQ
ncbi:hypothetical protein CNR22_21090 [Sphingobacteriaceae bacterium]|nr:hypothetical protein CNR22_21090 [Sphingobacteriaceae bacterium]